MAKTLTKRIRSFLDRYPQGRLKDLYQAHQDFDLRRVSRALERLILRGELALADPMYLYTARPHAGQAAKQARIWSVIRSLGKIERVIDSKKVALLADDKWDYSRKYMTWLAGQGYLARRAGGYFAVLAKALEQAEAPWWDRHKRQEGG